MKIIAGLIVILALSLLGCEGPMDQRVSPLRQAQAVDNGSVALIKDSSGKTLKTVEITLPVDPTDSRLWKNATIGSTGANFNNLLVFGSDESQTYRVFARCDLSAVPSGAIIVNAELGVFALSFAPSSATGEAAVYRLTTVFDEAALTWENQPDADWMIPYGLRPIGAGDGVTDLGAYNSWEIGDLVQYWVDFPERNYGFVLLGPEGGDLTVRAAAATASTAATAAGTAAANEWPHLTIAYVLEGTSTN